MLNVFKKVEKLRHDAGGVKGNVLEPPKNLPDLARDMYEREQLIAARKDSVSASSSPVVSSPPQVSVLPTNVPVTSSPISNAVSSSSIVEPSKDSVPKLDLALVKQHLAASEAAISSMPSSTQPLHQANSANVQDDKLMIRDNSMLDTLQRSVSQSLIHEALNNNINAIDDSTGFFKEFEEYIRHNGLNNEVIADLLDKNLLDNMMFYHSAKSTDMPFYASSSELSHAIKLKLEDLQNLERNWITNKQKLELLKKLSSTMESDIRLKSEEFKKLLAESRRRMIPDNVLSIGQKTRLNSVGSSNGISDSSNNFTHTAPAHTDVHTNVLSNLSNYAIYTGTNTSNKQNVVNNNITNDHVTDNHNTVDVDNSKDFKEIYISLSNGTYIVNDDSKAFYLSNGIALRSLPELIDALESMNDDTYRLYVNNVKNDFANWIMYVFNNDVLADRVRSLRNRYQVSGLLKSYLNLQ